MINKETILSMFDDKGTLLKWLKKVEKALRESVLSSVEVIKITDTRAVIKFIFADDTTISTPEFTLPEGAKGDKGDGVEMISSFSVYPPTSTVNGQNGGFFAQAGLEIFLNNGDSKRCNIDFNLPIEGSESVVVDVGEDGKTIEIHLDADIISKLSRSLLIPLSSQGVIRLVSVSPDNEQSMLGIGSGLDIKNDTIELKNYGLKEFHINTNGYTVGIRFFDCVYNGEYYKQLSLNRAFDGTEDIKCNFFKFWNIQNTSLNVESVSTGFVLDFSGLKELRAGNSLVSKISTMFVNEEDVTIEIDEPYEPV